MPREVQFDEALCFGNGTQGKGEGSLKSAVHIDITTQQALSSMNVCDCILYSINQSINQSINEPLHWLSSHCVFTRHHIWSPAHDTNNTKSKRTSSRHSCVFHKAHPVLWRSSDARITPTSGLSLSSRRPSCLHASGYFDQKAATSMCLGC